MSHIRVREIASMKDAISITHTLSEPGKMPGYSYNLPASLCQVGSKLAKQDGTICSNCYALKGRYVFPRVKHAMMLRYWSLGHPLWVEAMVFQISRKCWKVPFFRWRDSGDLQSIDHLRKIVEVALRTPTIKHWLPTREVNLVREYMHRFGPFPANLIVRLSAHKIGHDLRTELKLPIATVQRPGFGFQCGAYTRGGVCGPCRACWTSADINYPLH